MKRTKKTNNPIKKNTDQPIITSNSEFESPPEYFCMNSAAMMPARKQYIDSLFLEFRNEAIHNENMLFREDFTAKKGILRDTWYDWRTKSPLREQMEAEGMAAIGRRRERGAMTKQFAEKTVHFMQGMYSKDWVVEQERQAKLANDDNQAKNLKVVLTSYKEE